MIETHALSSAPSKADLSRSQSHDMYLDWLRGTAALLVFAAHVRGRYFVKWSDLDAASQTHLNYALFFLTRLGREAVMVFFVLSGFLVGGQAAASLREHRYSFGRYMIARIARLYTVLLPALVLTAVFDSLHSAETVIDDGWRALLINVLFLQGIFGSAYGSNGPLWSLAYEWWFYVLFGLGLLLIQRSSHRWSTFAWLSLAVIIPILWLRSNDILLLFPLWLFGAAARFIPAAEFSPAPYGRRLCYALAGSALFFGAVVFSNVRRDTLADYLLAIATVTVVILAKNLRPIRASWFCFGKTLAAFSFTLYAVHYPLNLLIQGLLVPRRLGHAGFTEWLGLMGMGLAECAVGYLLYLLFERHTPAVRKWLERLLLQAGFVGRRRRPLTDTA
jgi:peptidoglycan/LPS O-acetylase OafA/YrhL